MRYFAVACVVALFAAAILNWAAAAFTRATGTLETSAPQTVQGPERPRPRVLPTPGPSTPVPTPVAVAAPTISREKLLAAYQSGSATYHRIDRKEAKLMTQDDFFTWLAENGDGEGQRAYLQGTGPETIVWVVVVAGDISPDIARGSFKALWAVHWYVASTGAFLGSNYAGKRGNWPAGWDTLPDRDPRLR